MAEVQGIRENCGWEDRGDLEYELANALEWLRKEPGQARTHARVLAAWAVIYLEEMT